MSYVIDSGWVIDHLAGVPEATALLATCTSEGIAISIITYMEAFQGTLHEGDSETAQEKLSIFLQAAPVLPFTLDVTRRCALLRETLIRQKQRVRARALDLLVAATALEHDLLLVTRNANDCDDIPGLRLYRSSQHRE